MKWLPPRERFFVRTYLTFNQMIKFGLKSGPNYNFNKYRNQCNRKRMEANVTGNQQVQADVTGNQQVQANVNGNQQVQANVNGNQQVQANVIVNQQANEIKDQEGDDVSVIQHNFDNDALSSDGISANKDVTMANNTISTLNTSGRLAPKPQRDINFWLSYDCLIKAGLNKDGMQLMDEKGQVTCRQCLGFAHSIKNCSTFRRIENFKQFNQLAKTFFSQFQRKQIDRDLSDWETKITDEEVIETWPVKTALQEFLTSKKTIAARKKFDMVDSDAHSLSLFVQEMDGFKCHLCSGWGHMAKDNDPKNTNILKSKSVFCVTHNVIDRCLGFFGADLAQYRSYMRLKKSREQFEYGFDPRSQEHPYKTSFKPKNRKTHLKTYTEGYVPGSNPDDTFGLMENLNQQYFDQVPGDLIDDPGAGVPPAQEPRNKQQIVVPRLSIPSQPAMPVVNAQQSVKPIVTDQQPVMPAMPAASKVDVEMKNEQQTAAPASVMKNNNVSRPSIGEPQLRNQNTRDRNSQSVRQPREPLHHANRREPAEETKTGQDSKTTRAQNNFRGPSKDANSREHRAKDRSRTRSNQRTSVVSDNAEPMTPEEFDDIQGHGDENNKKILSWVQQWASAGTKFARSPDTGNCFQIELATDGAIQVKPIADNPNIKIFDPKQEEGHYVNYVIQALGMFLRKYPRAVTYAGDQNEIPKMLGVGGNKKNLEQMRATKRPSELEQMSTMKDLDKLLSDHLAPVQSEPVQSQTASQVSPGINFAGLTLHRLESFNSSVSSSGKGTKSDVTALSNELKEIMAWPINSPGDFIFLSGVEKQLNETYKMVPAANTKLREKIVAAQKHLSLVMGTAYTVVSPKSSQSSLKFVTKK